LSGVFVVKNGSKMRSMISWGIPVPLSVTRKLPRARQAEGDHVSRPKESLARKTRTRGGPCPAPCVRDALLGHCLAALKEMLHLGKELLPGKGFIHECGYAEAPERFEL